MVQVKEELEAIDYKKAMAKHELESMNNQITILSRDIYNKSNDLVYLNYGIQVLQGHIHRLENDSQQQQKIENGTYRP
jgi:peptidoglycan hydrolase CwlO-like protein